MIHVTGGGPPRGTELLDCCFENMQDSTRSIFVHSSMLVLKLTYSKTSSYTQADSLIYRYLPTQVSELLLKFILFIRPTQKVVLDFIGEDFLSNMDSANYLAWQSCSNDLLSSDSYLAFFKKTWSFFGTPLFFL